MSSARIAPLLLSLLVASVARASGPGVVPSGAEYGAGVTLGRIVPLEEVVLEPERFADEEIVVAGRISQVCQRKGCWLMLSDGDAAVRVRFLDYAFFVPRDASGARALVEGRVAASLLSEKDAKHYASEAIGGDPDAISGPQREISLTASGLRILARE